MYDKQFGNCIVTRGEGQDSKPRNFRSQQGKTFAECVEFCNTEEKCFAFEFRKDKEDKAGNECDFFKLTAAQQKRGGFSYVGDGDKSERAACLVKKL